MISFARSVRKPQFTVVLKVVIDMDAVPEDQRPLNKREEKKSRAIRLRLHHHSASNAGLFV
ncbi:hypothetical protein [Acinetobacter baumannii]|uniref:hypothetical protein n=1 Tax=Acinetobacter baumannii TaxID=470 RepID=UPI002949C625|nr:hypothetical protein [Acinetobacter baumannii]MDV5203728.1 hypothetical protein [Acinetobacter baumannii]